MISIETINNKLNFLFRFVGGGSVDQRAIDKATGVIPITPEDLDLSSKKIKEKEALLQAKQQQLVSLYDDIIETTEKGCLELCVQKPYYYVGATCGYYKDNHEGWKKLAQFTEFEMQSINNYTDQFKEMVLRELDRDTDDDMPTARELMGIGEEEVLSALDHLLSLPPVSEDYIPE